MSIDDSLFSVVKIGIAKLRDENPQPVPKEQLSAANDNAVDQITSFAADLDFYEAAEISASVSNRMRSLSNAHRTSESDALGAYLPHSMFFCYWNIARNLGLPYCGTVSTNQHFPAIRNVKDIGSFQAEGILRPEHWGVFSNTGDPARIAIAPSPENWRHLTALLTKFPFLRQHLSVCTPEAMRTATLAKFAPFISEIASGRLEKMKPGLTARLVASSDQITILCTIVFFLLACAKVAPTETALVLSCVFSMVFAISVALRLLAIVDHANLAKRSTQPIGHGYLPRYSVLVPLYDEASVVAQLIENLKRLEYPASRLEVIFIVESGDKSTIEALTKHCPGDPFRIHIVPPGGPRTKPNALNHAFASARGELVCIFDAEDRPDPDQLHRSAALLLGDPKIGVVQCKLTIENASESWIARQFAIEYEALFSGLLPVLDAYELPMPLGGTSNHFRSDVIRETGGWDPFNVTEDADLGIRISRAGYLCVTLDSRTYEEAPIHLWQWLPQRTRWFKGWLQSWLVQMREPRKLLLDLGPLRFCVLQALLLGMFLSATLHPFFAGLAAWQINSFVSTGQQLVGLERLLFFLCLFNFAAGYIGVLILAFAVLWRQGKWKWFPSLFLIPLYWCLLFCAAWRALGQLILDPWKWEKTSHGVSKQCGKG